MAIKNLLQNMHKWHLFDDEHHKSMATYDHVIQAESLSELELKYFNLAAACHMRDEELTATRARRDAAFIAWRNAGGYK